MESTKRYPAIALAAIAGLVLVVGVWLGRAQTLPQQVTTAQDPATDTPTPEATLDPTAFSDPIYTAQEAISRMLVVFSEDHDSITTTTRLISIGSLDASREGTSPLPISPPPLPNFQFAIALTSQGMAEAYPHSVVGGIQTIHLEMLTVDWS